MLQKHIYDYKIVLNNKLFIVGFINTIQYLIQHYLAKLLLSQFIPNCKYFPGMYFLSYVAQ